MTSFRLDFSRMRLVKSHRKLEMKKRLEGKKWMQQNHSISEICSTVNRRRGNELKKKCQRQTSYVRQFVVKIFKNLNFKKFKAGSFQIVIILFLFSFYLFLTQFMFADSTLDPVLESYSFYSS